MIGRPGRLVRGQSLPDAVLWKWEPPVPFVKRPVLGSSIFLYGSERDAKEGANWGGSGVLVGVSSTANPSRVHLYAVTNDHVAKPCPVVRLVNRTGDPYVLPGDRSDWVPHPLGDDIALRPLGAVPEGDYWYVPDDLLLSRTDLSPDDYPDQISPGDDCVMVGRYINQEHRQFDRPVVRFGNVAMLPELVHQVERSFDQESFLVDMRSHAGFSGSPVFVYYEEPGWRYLPPQPEMPPIPDAPKRPEELDSLKGQEFLDAHGPYLKELEAHSEVLSEARASDVFSKWVAERDVSGVMSKTWLLGIDWGHLPVWDDVFDLARRKTGRIRVSTGMAGVVPAWKLRDLLNEKGVNMARDKAEKQLSEVEEGTAILDRSEADEFAQFEELTRQLVQVPKRELDEKRKDES